MNTNALHRAKSVISEAEDFFKKRNQWYLIIRLPPPPSLFSKINTALAFTINWEKGCCRDLNKQMLHTNYRALCNEEGGFSSEQRVVLWGATVFISEMSESMRASDFIFISKKQHTMLHGWNYFWNLRVFKNGGKARDSAQKKQTKIPPWIWSSSLKCLTDSSWLCWINVFTKNLSLGYWF